MKTRILFLAFLLTSVRSSQLSSKDEIRDLLPTVQIVILVRNKAHILPHSLALLEKLDYPKNRISLWIRSDHNEDRTEEILKIWAKKWKDLINKNSGSEDVYHSINLEVEGKVGVRYPDQIKGPAHWSKTRFEHVMKLREEGLNAARRAWADWVWQLDADIFLTNPAILKILVTKESESTIVAPVLTSLGLYSNFWGGMSEQYYYERTETYEKILKRKKGFLGCHSVPMVHSSVLINLRRKDSLHLTYLPDNIPDYDGPFDDIITFAISAAWNDVTMLACNDHNYGYVMLPQGEESRLDEDLLNLSNMKLEIIAYNEPIPHTPELSAFVQPLPKKDTLGVDNVYMINLERRPDRRKKMNACLEELGVKYEWIKAVDGKSDVNEEFIASHGIKMMPEFEEPYHGRPVTYGEIGCFMSHYNVWRDILKNYYSKVIVLEDDVRFEPFFRSKVEQLLAEIKTLNLDWDLIFLGRKILHSVSEPWVENSNMLVHVNYTYWTLGYMLSNSGARKLVSEGPLSKIIPVDEYLPILYDRHPKENWKGYYQNRNLKAFSVHPLFIFPTHYTGEEGYLSDTEDSQVMQVPCDIKNSDCNPVLKDEL